MQNKPNFPDAQMNVTIYLQTAYENKSNWTLGQNKPNSNPIAVKPKVNVNLYLIEDYENETSFRLQKNKPNSNPISSKAKMNANLYVIEDYENETTFRPQQNKPKQSQGIKRIRRIFRRFVLAFLTQAPQINI